jgi:hypothetical protein
MGSLRQCSQLRLKEIYMHTIFTLDFFNDSYYFKQGAKQAFWNDKQQFLSDTGFPFINTGIVAVETDRNIYHVERPGAVNLTGESVEEVVWLLEHIELFLSIADQQSTLMNPTFTLEMSRQGRLFETDYILLRHQEETLLGLEHTLSEQQFQSVLAYRQALRDLTNSYSKDTPEDQVEWPNNPLN